MDRATRKPRSYAVRADFGKRRKRTGWTPMDSALPKIPSQLELPVACLMAGHGDMASEDHLSVILEKA